MSEPAGAVISLHGIRVLIVEDVPAIATLVSKLVTRFGAGQTDIVETVAAAWARLQTYEYDIVLLDYMLGREIGLPLVEALRASDKPQHARTAVILLTATKAKDILEKAIEVGADGFLVKPVAPDRLADRILKAVDARRKRAEKAGINPSPGAEGSTPPPPDEGDDDAFEVD